MAHRELLSQLNGNFLNGEVRGTLEENDYSAIDIIFPIARVFIYRLTGYMHSPKKTSVHSVYSSMMSTGMSDTEKL